MSNKPNLKPGKVSTQHLLTQIDGLQEHNDRQTKIIDRLKNDYLQMKRAANGAEIIAACLLKNHGEPVVLSREELEAADVSEVSIIERDDGGLLVRMEVKGEG